MKEVLMYMSIVQLLLLAFFRELTVFEAKSTMNSLITREICIWMFAHISFFPCFNYVFPFSNATNSNFT